MLRLEVERLDPIKRLSVEIPVPGLTIITGPNASGKTRTLSALYFANSLLERLGPEPSVLSERELKELVYVELPSHFPWLVKDGRLELEELEGASIRLRYWENEAFFEVENGNVRAGGVRGGSVLPVHAVSPYRSLIPFCTCNLTFPKMYADALAEFRERALKVGKVAAEMDAFEDVPKVVVEGMKYYIEARGRKLEVTHVASGWSELAFFYAFTALLGKGERVLMIEEPEVHLHPSSVKRFVEHLIKLVKEKSYGIIVTTHDPMIGITLDVLMRKGLECKSNSEGRCEDFRWYFLKRGPEGSTSEEIGIYEGVGVERNDLLEEYMELMLEYVWG